MAIIGTLPNNIQNGQAVDANPVMADFNFIVNQVNANANPLGTLTAPSGTRIAFQQATAPLGWITDATLTDHSLHISATTGGTISAGVAGYSGFLAGTWATAGHALTIAELASHTHTDSGHSHTATDSGHNHVQNVNTYYNAPGIQLAGGTSINITAPGGVVTNTGTANITVATGTANLQNTGSGSAHTHNMTTTWNYADFIVAAKT